jgi:hypothetical protein
MGALAWVELLDRRGHVRTRHRIDSLPALIGRSYGCDVLVDDPWISPIHVRIYRDLDGSFKVEDAGSENGLWIPDEERRVTLLPLGRGVTLRAGHTLFRLVPADLTVPPALAMHVAAPAAGGWEQWWVGPVAALVAGATFGYSQFLGDASSHGIATVIGEALLMIAVMALWSGIWALATRAVWHRARFLDHFTIVSLAALAMIGVLHAVEYAAFIAPGAPDLEETIGLVSLVVFTAMLYGHLAIATSLPKLRIAAISTAIVFGLVGLGALVASEEGADGGGMPRFSAQLKPLNARLIPVQDTTLFFDGIKELKTSVDSLAREPQ